MPKDLIQWGFVCEPCRYKDFNLANSIILVNSSNKWQKLTEKYCSATEFKPVILYLVPGRGVCYGKSDCLVFLKTSRLTKNRRKTYEGPELAQNGGQIWTHHA